MDARYIGINIDTGQCYVFKISVLFYFMAAVFYPQVLEVLMHQKCD